MTGARTMPASVYARIKTATKRLIKEHGTADSAAMDTRVSESQVVKYQNPHQPDFMPADVIADLEHVAGAPHLTRLLAELSGYALVKLPDAREPQSAEMKAFLHWLKESSDVTASLSTALDVGQRITLDEIRDLALIREVNEGIDALVQVRALLQRIEAGDG